MSMQTTHETLLVISIIVSFCAQLKNYFVKLSSRQNIFNLFERTQILKLKIFGRVLRIQHYFMKIVMLLVSMRIYPNVYNVPNCTIFSINQISLAENHSLKRSTKFEPISFLI